MSDTCEVHVLEVVPTARDLARDQRGGVIHAMENREVLDRAAVGRDGHEACQAGRRRELGNARALRDSGRGANADQMHEVLVPVQRLRLVVGRGRGGVRFRDQIHHVVVVRSGLVQRFRQRLERAVDRLAGLDKPVVAGEGERDRDPAVLEQTVIRRRHF